MIELITEFKRLIKIKSWYRYFKDTSMEWIRMDIKLYKLYRLGKRRKNDN